MLGIKLKLLVLCYVAKYKKLSIPTEQYLMGTS